MKAHSPFSLASPFLLYLTLLPSTSHRFWKEVPNRPHHPILRYPRPLNHRRPNHYFPRRRRQIPEHVRSQTKCRCETEVDAGTVEGVGGGEGEGGCEGWRRHYEVGKQC
ncbi:hypothetical protein BJ165DRAFT_1512239 [Panaeolus papilionaceus]|nr:hypothetical protein BJ165DRAFT_1512239 [Panaeolus papilionaceus]